MKPQSAALGFRVKSGRAAAFLQGFLKHQAK
jgi:hypothetical protein